MTIRELIQDFKAWRRGEVRVARGLRGRTHMRKSDIQAAGEQGSSSVVKAPHKTTVRMTARHIHADGSPDTLYDLGTMKQETPNG